MEIIGNCQGRKQHLIFSVNRQWNYLRKTGKRYEKNECPKIKLSRSLHPFLFFRNGSVIAYFYLDFDKNSALSGEDIADIFNTSLSQNNTFGFEVDVDSIQVTHVEGKDTFMTC